MSKRRRGAVLEDKENTSIEPPTKISKSSSNIRYSAPSSRVATTKVSTAPAKKRNAAVKKSTSTPAKKTAPAKKVTQKAIKPTNPGKSAEQLYKSTIKDVNKEYKALLRKYVPNSTAFSGVTSDDFSQKFAEYNPKVEVLLTTSPKLAFNLLMYIGEHVYGDLETGMKSSGWGETDEPFQEMDELMVKVIDMRVNADGKGQTTDKPEDTYYAPGESEAKAFRDTVYSEKKRPNKQEWKTIQNLRRSDFAREVEERMKLREETMDWVANALADLIRTKDDIAGYGIGEHYFRQSIEKLEKLKDEAVD